MHTVGSPYVVEFSVCRALLGPSKFGLRFPNTTRDLLPRKTETVFSVGESYAVHIRVWGPVAPAAA